MCGEHSTSNDFSRTPAGSSPRVRGTRGGLPARRHGHRIIPACAGNTSKAGPGAISTRDHPRVCGEHAFLPLRYEYREGSSPRVRGTRKHTCATCRTSGIIPACAGNTPFAPASARWGRDHPRVCGEHFEYSTVTYRVEGSSPRVRGTHGHERDLRIGGGIIPACAGNTRRHRCAAHRARDHPRVCGEHRKGSQLPPSVEGSSPRVRGTPYRAR